MANTKTSALNALAGSALDGADYFPVLDSSATELKKLLASDLLAIEQRPNVLINGGFDFAQRQTPGTLTAITTDKYSADRWRISRETASLQYARVDTNGSLESGITGRYYGQFKQITSAGKFAIYQPVEAINTFPLASRVVSFQCKLKASSSKTIRLGLVQLNSSGTVDTINATVVPTWGSNSTDPTLATNHARITPSAAVSNGSVSGSGISCSVTSSWQQFGGVFTMPSNAKNIIPMIWTDSQFSANDSLYVAEAGLYDGSALRAWLPRSLALENSLCRRYCYSQVDGAFAALRFSTDYVFTYSVFPVQMRTTPTMTTSITGWVGGTTPASTEVAGYNLSAAGNISITGSLSLSAAFTSDVAARIAFQASSSFDGSAGASAQIRLGTAARIIYDAEL